MQKVVAALALLCGVWPGTSQADDWERLDGPGIAFALTARALGYPDGTLQDFMADGRTLYGESWGIWRVEGDRYCSLWPPSDRWSCFAVDRRKLDIRFTGDDGVESIGRYVDLQ